MKNFKLFRELLITFFICFILIKLTAYLLYVQYNLSNYIVYLKNKFEIYVFLNKDEKASEVIQEKIRNSDNIDTITYISKKEIKEKMHIYEKEIQLTENENPFPDTICIHVKNINKEDINKLDKELCGINSVDGVNYDAGLLNIISGLTIFYRFTKYSSIIIFFILFLLLILVLTFKYKIINKDFFEDIRTYLHIISGLLGLFVSFIIFIKTTRILKENIEQFNNFNINYLSVLVILTISVIFIRLLSITNEK